MDKELTDTASSLNKQSDTHMIDVEKNAKKRLAFEQNLGCNGDVLAITSKAHGEEGSLANENIKKDDGAMDKKRHKKIDGTSVFEASIGSATSLEDDRRKQ